MRRIPTTSLRSTLLALLLTLCLALPALAAQKEGLLLVAFGTSVPEAQPALTAIDKEFKAAFPHSPVIWAYTSSIIRAKLEKKGVHIGDVAAGLEELARQKVDVVRVQSLHVVAGEEFSEMERLLVSWLVRHPDSFKASIWAARCWNPGRMPKMSAAPSSAPPKASASPASCWPS